MQNHGQPGQMHIAGSCQRQHIQQHIRGLCQTAAPSFPERIHPLFQAPRSNHQLIATNRVIRNLHALIKK